MNRIGCVNCEAETLQEVLSFDNNDFAYELSVCVSCGAIHRQDIRPGTDLHVIPAEGLRIILPGARA